MYIDRDIDIYWYYNDNSYNSADNGDGGDDDGNNANRNVAIIRNQKYGNKFICSYTSDFWFIIWFGYCHCCYCHCCCSYHSFIYW